MIKHWVKKTTVAAVFALTSLTAAAAIDVYDFESEQKEQEFRELTLQLRCPKCQNNSIGDSNAVIATDMRAKVYELMQQGYSKQQVIDYMIERYGNFVTYQPPVTAATSILWLGPLLFLVAGAFFIVKLSRRKSALTGNDDELPQEDNVRLQHLLKDDSTDKKRGKTS
jgi:cytochrome c-type biogenesis protein CcmH